jgi:hypothetical protein
MSGFRSTNKKPLPPYARQWLDAGARYGPQVICGAGAWQFAEHRKRNGFALVAPPDRDPLEFDWSLLAGRSVVLIELGSFDTAMLERVAYALMRDGVPMVFPIRDALLAEKPPQVWPCYMRDEHATATR